MRFFGRNKRNAREVIKADHKLICPICSHDRFLLRKVKIAPKVGFFDVLFFNLDVLKDTNATNYICARCHYIFWFLD